MPKVLKILDYLVENNLLIYNMTSVTINAAI